MNLNQFNDAFKRLYESTADVVEDSFEDDLRNALTKVSTDLQNSGVGNIKQYEIAFQDEIEKLVPDKSWWEVTDCNIFYELFLSRDVEGCINKIISELKPEYKTNLLSTETPTEPETLTEAPNPENEEINSLIRDIVNGDSRAYSKLRKLGYEVEVDDSARKEYGPEYFGRHIKIRNTATGRVIYADNGHRWHSKDAVVAGGGLPNTPSRNIHHIKNSDKRPGTKSVDPRAFDYKGYLDKPLTIDTSSKTAVQQFKDDKRFVKDNEYTIRRGKEAEDRLADIRSRIDKMKSNKPINESFGDSAVLLQLLKDYDEFCNTENKFLSDIEEFISCSAMYESDCLKWVELDASNVFQTGMYHCINNDSYTTDFTDFVRGAVSEFVYAFISKFKEIYTKHQENV